MGRTDSTASAMRQGLSREKVNCQEGRAGWGQSLLNVRVTGVAGE